MKASQSKQSFQIKLSNSQEAIQKLDYLKGKVRECIVYKTFRLPFFIFIKQFNTTNMRYESRAAQQMVLGATNIKSVTRLLQIIQVLLQVLNEGEFVTKRNLYYRLVRYYQNYDTLDDDLELLSSNAGLSREELGVISSSRCLMMGDIQIEFDERGMRMQGGVVMNVPAFRQIKVNQKRINALLIVQKESAMYQLQQMFTKAIQENQYNCPEWLKDLVVVSSKGYPDRTGRRIIQSLWQRAQKIFYLGDEDIFGADILLCYCIGYRQFSTFLPRVTWIDPSTMIPAFKLQNEYLQQNKEDHLKAKQMLQRPYFSMREISSQEEAQFYDKISEWKIRLQRMVKSDKKIELEAYLKYLPNDWLKEVI